MVNAPPVAHPSCPACDGARVEVGVRTDIDHQETKLWRKTRHGWGIRDVTSVRALAYAGCGLVTFHVKDLANLQAELTKHPELFKWDD
jgi:hypothetical protein